MTAFRTTASLALILCLVGPAAPARADDPLPSWDDGPSRGAIVAFVEAVTTEGSPDFVTPGDRIAVFDNDGTLWCERPVYVQAAFIADRVAAMVEAEPALADRPGFKAVLDRDFEALAGLGEAGIAELVAATHGGMTPEEFEAMARDWLATARHPRFGRPYTELTYQPMVELLDFLRSHGFSTFIVTGGGVEFVRNFAEPAYGIPTQQVVGSTIALRFEEQGDEPTIVREPRISFIDDGPGKPVGIQSHIGRRPILAVGNSDGDYEMLRWTTAGPGPRLGLIVHHTDADREYAYDRDSHVGRLDRALDEAPDRGWVVIDMKRDWESIFPGGSR
ncbi:HAD family hydrolase [Tautonia sp. JC769]|uniref:HAD family hydrolase n=1 Tax=Tautonia sp. JC769 TaxID=3232135 RepID=UPI00345B3876